MIIRRDELIDRLVAFSESGHGLVAGEPGVGKTYSIASLHDSLTVRGVPHAIIPVDRLGSITAAEIRSVLGIEKDLISYFGDRFAGGKGVVVFDGFDAVRNDAGRERLLSVIRRAVEEAQGRWNVVVSVRLFDAERSQGLRDLFRDQAAGKPHKGIGLSETRLFRVPRLTDAEVTEGIAQIPGLDEIAKVAAPEFRELLHVPFNLWLVNQILGTKGAGKSLSAVASEVQLLGLYWNRRVLASDRADESRSVLAKVVGEMVDSHSLNVRRDAVYEIAASAAWSDLLSAGVLVEAGTAKQRIGFAHNILFDYAVSILLLDDEPAAMAEFIAADFGRPLFLRPSITYYFTRLWYDARPSFWRSAWATHSSTISHVRLVGRLIPPSVIIRETRMVGDLEPVFTRIDKADGGAADFFLRILQAHSAIGSGRVGLWAEVCAEAANRPRREYAWNVATTVSGFWPDGGPAPSTDIQKALGQVGRGLLRWALDTGDGTPDRYLDAVGALWALPLVAKTYATDAGESEKLLRRVLALIEVPGFQIQYFTQLADTVADLAPTAPALLADIYRAVFGHTETSEEETNFGSPILPLRSTRRQDFGMCEYALDKDFPSFLKTAPVVAASAALDAFNEFVVASHIRPYLRDGKTLDDLKHAVEFRGQKTAVVQDHSAIWLDSAYPDYALNLVTKLIEHLESAAAAGDTKLVGEVLDVFSLHARTQASWTLLLRSGKQKPEILAPLVADLTRNRDLFRAAYYEVATFVEATFSHWSADQQKQFEEFVVGMLNQAEEESAIPKGLVDRAVIAVPPDLIKSDAIKERRQQLIEQKAVPKNEPPYRMETFSREYTNEEWLTDQGVDTKAPENRKLIEAAADLEKLTQPWQNERPDASAADALAKAMEASLELLQQAPEGTPRDLSQMLSTRIAASARVIARAKDGVSQGSLSRARAVLLEAAKSVEEADGDEGGKFDTPAWSPSPLTEAAQGLPWVVTRGDDSEVTRAIEGLSRSSVPAVRFLTATELFRLRWSAEDDFWRIAGRFAESETSRGVLVGLMHSFGSIKKEDASRIASLLQTLSKRGITVTEERSQYGEAYGRLLAWLAFNVEEPWGLSTVEAIADDPLQSPELTKRLAFEAMAIVTPEFLKDTRVGPMSRRAFAWTRRLLAGVVKALPVVKEDASGEKARTLYGVVDDVASRLYFGTRRGQQDETRSAGELSEYLTVVRPMIEDIIKFGTQKGAVLIAHTAHHLMELLRACLPLDPRGVLHLAADVAVASQSGGYNLDAMAVREVVEIANTLLTDFREAIAEGKGLEDYVRLLDTFANAGWPEALRLLWRVDEVFR